MIHLPARRLLAALAAATLAGSVAMIAPPASGSAPAALLRGAHFSPDTPGVDVYLTAFSGGTTRLWLSEVGYGDVSGYERIASGPYAVAMRPHGAAASTPAALTWTLDARPGAAYTAAAVGLNKQLKGIVLHDTLTAPKPGTGRVRVIQAASRAPRVDVAARGGSAIARGVAFASSTEYATVPAGTLLVDVRSTGSPALTASGTVRVAAGSVDTIVVLDAATGGGIAVRSVQDAAGAATTPIGAVPAGGGGTAAGQRDRAPWLPTVVFALVGLCALGAAMWPRRVAR